MVQCRYDRVKHLDLLMARPPRSRVGNQNKEGMIFIFYHALYEETRYNVGSLAM
jgi:hypothetical protein